MLASASTPFPSTSMTDNELITALLTLQDTSFSLDGFGESGNSSSLPNTTATTIDSSERSINPRDLSVRQKDTTSDMAIDSQQIPAETCNVVPVHGGSGALSPHCANPPQPLTSSLPAIYPALLSSDDNGGDADQSSLSVAAQGSHSTADISLPSLASDKSNATSPTPFSSDISRWVETVYQEYTSPSDVRVIILPRFGSGINSTLVAGTLFWGALHTRTCSRLRRMMQQRQSQVKKSKCKNINVARSPSTEQDGPDTHSHGLNTPSALQVQDQICFEENEKAAASHPERDTSSDTSQDMEEDSADELAQDDDLSSESDVRRKIRRSVPSIGKLSAAPQRTKPIDLRSHLAMGRAATQQAVAAAAKYRKCKTHTPKPVNQFELDTVREVTGEEWDIDASAGGRHLPIYSLPEDWLSLRELLWRPMSLRPQTNISQSTRALLPFRRTSCEQSDRVDPVLLFNCHLPRPWLAPMSQREHRVAEFGPPTTIMQGRVPDVHGAPVDDKDQLYTLSLWDLHQVRAPGGKRWNQYPQWTPQHTADYVDWLRRPFCDLHLLYDNTRGHVYPAAEECPVSQLNFCLMTLAGSWTGTHMDASGFCTIIHVKHGVKRVIVKIPRKKLSDRKKIHLSDYDESFFDSYIINLNAGEWVMQYSTASHTTSSVHSGALVCRWWSLYRPWHYVLSMKASIIINHSFSIFTNASHNQAVVSLLHRHVLLALHPFDATLRSFAMNGELSVSDTNLLPHDSDLVICCGAVVFADIIWPSESDQTREVSDGALAAVQNAYAAAAEYCILDGEELSNEALAEHPNTSSRLKFWPGHDYLQQRLPDDFLLPNPSSHSCHQSQHLPEDSDPEFEAELVVGHVDGADALVHGERAYMVKWKGYPDSENCLVTASDTYNMRDLVHEYWDRQRQRNARKTRRKRQKMRRRHQDSHPNPSSSSSS
ncbi:hypothetical protein BKA62DRAFT_675707 [Auriculariales sp. MPI-PUGE-AT-0066]|nr:hypothetical protein BKA62DRAFT_675707 [Auriculariales sp. MPI-PUGE-AT-0066]